MSGCDYETTGVSNDQWALIKDWMEKRVSFANLLLKFKKQDDYRNLSTRINDDHEFDVVREVADVLAAAGVQFLKFFKS